MVPNDNSLTNNKKLVKTGSTIRVEYTGTLDDGSLFDSSEVHGQPLQFEVGAGSVLKAFDEAVRDMEIGEEKEFRLEPAEAYGEYHESLVDTVSRDLVQANMMEMEIGKTFIVQTPEGQQMHAKVIELTDEEVTFDLNHPLAGKALTFKIKIIDIL